MEIALVANAASGSGTDVGSVERMLAARDVRVRTMLPNDLPERVEVDRVAVAAGDGTIGSAAALAARSGVPLAVIPVGTANDFARHLGVPPELDEAAALAADPAAARRRLDLGWVDGIPFVNAASAGLSVTAGEAATPLKSLLGPLAYTVGGVAAAVRARSLPVRVRCDGRECFAGEAWQITVAGTGAFGGGSQIDVADATDGQFDVAVMEAGPRLRLARHAIGMRSGGLVDQPGVEHVRGRVVTVEGPSDWNVDGEMHKIGPATFRVERGAFEAVVGTP